MKFTCTQKKLSDSISIVQKAISPRTTHPILEGIFLKAYKGILKLIGNDLDLGIECFWMPLYIRKVLSLYLPDCLVI